MKLGNWFLVYNQDDVMASTLGRHDEDVEIALAAKTEKNALKEAEKKWATVKQEDSKRQHSIHPSSPKVIYKILIKEGVKK